MTGAGLALIAGGLATLISFRSILFGGGERDVGRGGGRSGGLDVGRSGERSGGLDVGRSGERSGGLDVGRSGERDVGRSGVRGRDRGGEGGAERRARRRAARAIEPPRRQAALPASRAAVADEADGEGKSARRGRRGRRRALVAASAGGEVPWESDEDERGGLASIGLADEDDESFVPEAILEQEIETVPEPVPARADRYGDRVEGWVRPEYQDPPDEPRPGEYWTPIPVDLAGDPEPSAKGYGWPRPVERLPAVPDYEPATGFDLIPISEPTEVVPTWAMNDDRPGRIRLPRSWNTRNEKPSEEPSEMPGPRRPRPRPRPRPEQPADPSTVYVSRHAADPPSRRE